MYSFNISVTCRFAHLQHLFLRLGWDVKFHNITPWIFSDVILNFNRQKENNWLFFAGGNKTWVITSSQFCFFRCWMRHFHMRVFFSQMWTKIIKILPHVNWIIRTAGCTWERRMTVGIYVSPSHHVCVHLLLLWSCVVFSVFFLQQLNCCLVVFFKWGTEWELLEAAWD